MLRQREVEGETDGQMEGGKDGRTDRWREGEKVWTDNDCCALV